VIGHRIELRGPLDLVATLGPLVHGRADRTTRLAPDEAALAFRTPDGPAALLLRLEHPGVVTARAWGSGAEHAIASAAELVGEEDRPELFDPQHAVLADLVRRHPGLRLPRTRRVLHTLVPTVLEQKVTGTDARRSWRRLVLELGEPAPGPGQLRLPPSPDTLARTPSWVFHRANVERKRAHTVTRAMARAHRLEETRHMAIEDAYTRLLAFPGIGPWSAAEVAGVALGDPDAVSVGDFHLKNIVAYALAGEPRASDERMVELLEPWRGDRARVVRLIERFGPGAPRYGPKVATPEIASL
jgi:3-methyladenine DNA glycosylase/8-oxoguanine DNA glycosylase